MNFIPFPKPNENGYTSVQLGSKQMRKYLMQKGSENTEPKSIAKIHLTARVRSQHSYEKPFVNTLQEKYLLHIYFKDYGKKFFPGLFYAVSQMNVGEKSKFIIPPELAYGKEGRGREIPPNSWIIADIWLIEGDGKRALGVGNWD